MSLLRSHRRGRALQLLAAIAPWLILAAAATVLLRAPMRGMADNQDGWRVRAPAGIRHVDTPDNPPLYVQRVFRLDSPRWGGMSSGAVTALLARAPSDLAGRTHFDLRQLALVYLLLVAGLLALAQRAGVNPIVLCGALWALSDPEALLFFGSFYGVSAALVSVFGLLLWFGARRHMGALPMVVLVSLGAFSQQAHVIVGVVAFVALIGRVLRPLRRARVLVLLAVAIPTVGAVYHFERGDGPRFPEMNGYHAVFLGVAAVSSDPARHLDALGFEPDDLRFVRRSWFRASVPDDLAARAARLNRFRLAAAYASDPPALEAMLRAAAAKLVEPTPFYLGNYERSAGRSPRSQWDPWFRFRHVRAFLVGTPFVLVILAAAAHLAMAGTRPARRAMGFAALIFVAEVVVALLGEGFFSLRRHLVVAGLGLDFLLVVVVAHGLGAVATLLRGASGRRESGSHDAGHPATHRAVEDHSRGPGVTVGSAPPIEPR